MIKIGLVVSIEKEKYGYYFDVDYSFEILNCFCCDNKIVGLFDNLPGAIVVVVLQKICYNAWFEHVLSNT